jgi:hydrogenase-4 component F
MLHAVNHSFVKAGLFLVAGNILHLYGSTNAHEVRGLFQRHPLTAALLIAGLFSIGGFPPFGLFISEFTIFQAAIHLHVWLGVLFAFLLAVAFLGMASVVIPMVQDRPLRETPQSPPVPLLSNIAPLILLTVVLLLGVYVPPFLQGLLESASRLLGAGR